VFFIGAEFTTHGDTLGGVAAIRRQPVGTRPPRVKDGIIARRGTRPRTPPRAAAARELLTLVFYGIRDGHIRRASRPGQAA
jgi:hypothetical protein